MSNSVLAITLFVMYAIFDQWAFRCQRVGRGLLLLAKDSAAGHPRLFSAIMPTQFVNAMWLRRLLWVASIFFAWRAWRWAGVVPVVLYNFFLGAFVDTVSPWPSHSSLLQLFKRRVGSGQAGIQALFLLPVIDDVEKAMETGAHFEKLTTGVWLGRAVKAAEVMNEAERARSAGPPTSAPQP